MYKHILIATDGSDLAGKAVSHGLALAKALGAKTTAVMVTEPWAAMAPPEILSSPLVQDYERAVAARAERVLAAVSEAAKEANVACSTLHMRDRLPADGILEAAEASGCDLVVMASHGWRGLVRLVLGSETAEVLTRATIPVLVCR
jgi:nucleotide-binding universal stress UspA family protein